MRFRITHHTTYSYAESVSLSHNVVRLRPRNHGRQTCLQHELTVAPSPIARNQEFDYFGNHVAYFCLQSAHTQLKIVAESEVELAPSAAVDIPEGPTWEQTIQMLLSPPDERTLRAREYCFDSPYVARSSELADYALSSFVAGRPLLACVLDLTLRIHAEFEFLPGSTKVGTPTLDVLRMRRGVCQDFAHLQIGCLRSLGLAARYVSGYLVTTPPPGQGRLSGADVSHAWCSVYAPGVGWVDFDPTNGLIPSDAHITVAWARDYDDVGPIKGILVGGRRQRLEVGVDVVPVSAAEVY